ncbi:Lrp/AsnC family transcriptional regulator [Janthinobacterium sp. 17J80-10]|nr:Lrp/AsnC family transcriptional regulator [Janthinobacterium sp. 17J80-10]QAU33877.1 Lrp/AsnC family transcriptional regulator [Janthinobacterium sp. 17J80-10]
MLDKADWKLLTLLQKDNRIAPGVWAEKLPVSQPTCLRGRASDVRLSARA